MKKGNWNKQSGGRKEMRRRKVTRTAAGLGFLLAVGMAFPALADTVYVNASALNYRNRPSKEADAVLGTYPRGTKLERVSNQGEWSEVRVENSSYSVYVATRYLTEAAPAGKSGTEAGSSLASASWEVGLDENAPYASFSAINSGKAVYYQSASENRKGKTVCVNAGHGTAGGESVKTYCHPDKTPKVTGGTTGAGATMAVAVSSGMTFADGTAERDVTLEMAKIFRDKLLADGYDVLMIRESEDVQLDNVARTVLANQQAHCHIALHWDSTSTDKGAFYMSVPSQASYRAMEPVASHWQSHNQLGECLIEGLRGTGNKIFSSGSMEMDLTQTSYSTVPSVDIELGDKASSHSAETLERQADGLLAGVNRFFGF
ncbi:MAG TPA: N-acetylmuramoyl-L-alanine amidase [Candidatus Copromonas faecavium]|uniref:N-acetylmuramoyl-L-alanine amidase n=1 Tax=Candidatus Copromonas faecavium (nom. illeg.) TaxID=2840740 RepID=A0A9D1A485_9FIRM|nr:N-acetylmuramoyl-L-alanine amidase [Candidatus Copromonas faecavium]